MLSYKVWLYQVYPKLSENNIQCLPSGHTLKSIGEHKIGTHSSPYIFSAAFFKIGVVKLSLETVFTLNLFDTRAEVQQAWPSHARAAWFLQN